MELYYNIVKNVYKTYTKRINSIYKFLIGSHSKVHIYTDFKLLIEKYNALQNHGRYFQFSRLALVDHYSNL